MTYKVLHTSDWHLGKKLYRLSRIEEQKLFLNWLSDLIITENIDALFIAGDIFDTPNPPSNALKIYFQFLKNVTDNSHCHIYIIAGNHDSGRFLEAPSGLLEDHRVTVIGQLIQSDGIDLDRFKIKLPIGETHMPTLF